MTREPRRAQRRRWILEHGVLGFIVVAGLGASLVRDRITVDRFGLASGFDGYLIALSVILFVVQVPSGALGAALIPKLTGPLRHATLHVVLTRSVAFSLVAALAIMGLNTVVARWLMPGRDVEHVASMTMAWLAPVVPLVVASVAITAALQVAERAIFAAYAPLVRHLSFVCWIALAGDSWRDLLIASLFGYVAESLFLLGGLGRTEFTVRVRWSATAGLSSILRESTWLTFNGLALGSMAVVDQAMAAPLGDGSVSSLVYGSRGPSALLAVATLAVGATLLPRLVANAGELDRFRRLVWGYATAVLLVGVLVAAMGFWFASLIHVLLFGDSSFSTRVTLDAVDCQQAYWLQVPFYLLSGVASRAVIALGRSSVLVFVGVLMAVTNYAANYIARELWGVVGLAYATAFVYLMAAIAMTAIAVAFSMRRSEPDADQPTGRAT